jgi:hypothetical protein
MKDGEAGLWLLGEEIPFFSGYTGESLLFLGWEVKVLGLKTIGERFLAPIFPK